MSSRGSRRQSPIACCAFWSSSFSPVGLWAQRAAGASWCRDCPHIRNHVVDVRIFQSILPARHLHEAALNDLFHQLVVAIGRGLVERRAVSLGAAVFLRKMADVAILGHDLTAMDLLRREVCLLGRRGKRPCGQKNYEQRCLVLHQGTPPRCVFCRTVILGGLEGKVLRGLRRGLRRPKPTLGRPDFQLPPKLPFKSNSSHLSGPDQVRKNAVTTAVSALFAPRNRPVAPLGSGPCPGLR